MFSANLDHRGWRYLAPLVLLVNFLWSSWYTPDVWYHLAWGRDLVTHHAFTPLRRTLLEQPIPANTYWLFQALLYLTYTLGGVLLGQGLFGVAWIATATLTVRRGIGPWMATLMVIVAQTRFEPRPEVLSYLALMLMIGFAGDERAPSRWRLFALFVTQVLWSNVHGFFALGPLVVSARAIGAGRRWREWMPPLLASVAATVVSPFGWNNWSTVFTYAKLGAELKDAVAELAPPSLAAVTPALVAYAIVLMTSLFAPRPTAKRSVYAHLLALGGLALATTSTRNLTLAALLCAPLWQSSRHSETNARFERYSLSANVALCLALAGAFAAGLYGKAFHHPGSFGPKLEPAAYPRNAATYLRSIGFAGRLFAGPNDGGYFEWMLPEARVIGDSYFADAALTREYLAAARDPVVFTRLDERFHFDAAVIGPGSFGVYERLRADEAFRVAPIDAYRALFVRDWAP